MHLPISLVVAAALTGAAVSAAHAPRFVVATHNVRLDTDTAVVSIPVEALRGETWEVVKTGRKTVVLSFAPDDPRRKNADAIGLRATFRLPADAFAAAFVDADRWPEVRRGLAESLASRLPDLSIEERERVVSGEVWVGMSRAAAEESVGHRILGTETSETATGVEETWRVVAFSLAGTVATMLVSQETLDSMVRIILTFRDGRVTEIRRVTR